MSNKMAQTIKFPVIQYIKLTRPMEFIESPGRYTYLSKDAPGFFVDETNIEHLYGFTEDQKKTLVDRLNEARGNDQYLALLAGYPVVVSENDFVKIDPPKITPVPMGLVCGDV